MALFAVGAQLPPVNIGVTILAALADAGEYRLDVTLGTRDGLMHPTQRILRPVVIKLGNRADGFPCVGGVTVLAGYVQVAVRTMRAPRGLRVACGRNSGKRQN